MSGSAQSTNSGLLLSTNEDAGCWCNPAGPAVCYIITGEVRPFFVIKMVLNRNKKPAMKIHRPAPALVPMTALISVLTIGQSRPAFACDTCQLEKSGTFIGRITLMGNGTVRSWVQLNKSGKPESIGVTFSEMALTGLTQTPPKGMEGMPYTLALPKEAAVTGFDHIGLDWNPKGHLPKAIYGKPHFDFHFYQVTASDLKKITATGADLARINKRPVAKYLPLGFITPPGTGVPQMGAHALDASTPELRGKPFTHTLTYGYYNGKVTFIEPMITREFLQSKTNVKAAIKQPTTYQKRGYYPTSYSIKYDPIRKEHTVSLDGLTLRTGENQKTKVIASR